LILIWLYSFVHAARDYVEGMWRMLQQGAPEDFVLATGEMHYVREFVEKAFRVVGVEIKLVGLPAPSVSKIAGFL
jgi:GDP-D-mannose dehydratase